MYPNPAKGDVLNISSADNSNYRIISILGQEIAKGKIENGIISISNITTGIYLLEISTNGKPIIKRFIKQ